MSYAQIPSLSKTKHLAEQALADAEAAQLFEQRVGFTVQEYMKAVDTVPRSELQDMDLHMTRLFEHHLALAGVQRARGNGHFLFLELQDRSESIGSSYGKLNDIRQRAIQFGAEPIFSLLMKPLSKLNFPQYGLEARHIPAWASAEVPAQLQGVSQPVDGLRALNGAASLQGGILTLEDGTSLELAAIVDFVKKVSGAVVPGTNDAEHELLTDLITEAGAVVKASGLQALDASAPAHPTKKAEDVLQGPGM